MNELNLSTYRPFKALLKQMFDKGYEVGLEAGLEAAQSTPEARLGQIALDQAHVKDQLAALDTELDLSKLDDYELLRLLNQRGLAQQTRYYADLAWVELERRHGTQGLFDLLGILGGK